MQDSPVSVVVFSRIALPPPTERANSFHEIALHVVSASAQAIDGFYANLRKKHSICVTKCPQTTKCVYFCTSIPKMPAVIHLIARRVIKYSNTYLPDCQFSTLKSKHSYAHIQEAFFRQPLDKG